MTQQQPPAFERRYAIQAVERHIYEGTPEIIARGPRGCGKTLSLCWLFHSFALMYPGMVQLWIRYRRARLTDAVLKTYETEVLPMTGFAFPKVNRDNRKSYIFPNGSEIILQGMDDPSRQKSIGADLIWVNEPTEITVDDWEEIGASLRKTVGSSCPFRVKVGDINPAPPRHWTNTRCQPFPPHLYPHVLDDGTRMAEWFTPQMYLDTTEENLKPPPKGILTKMIMFTYPDNPGYWDVTPDKWGWTKAGLEYVQNMLGRLTGRRRQKYLEGRPVAEEGVVFPEFDEELHVEEPFGIGDWPVLVAYDPGYDHPCGVAFIAIAPNGQPLIVDEIYGSSIPLDALAGRIKEKIARKRYNVTDWLADPYGAFARTQGMMGLTVSDIMAQEHGLSFRRWPAAKGRQKQAQVENVRSWLCYDEKPLRVFRHCSFTISEFQSWAYKRNADGSIPEGDDAYEDRNNDLLDPIMGTLATRPSVTQDRASLMKQERSE